MIRQYVATRLSKSVCERCPDRKISERCPDSCQLRDAYVSQHVALVRLSDTRLSRFIFFSIISLSHGRKQLLAAAYGQGKPGLNLDNIRNMTVFIPPLMEVQEIVRRVETLFALADQIEARYAKAKAHVDKVSQSILAKAFCGELVPQDLNDEPADVLLKRIREGQLADAPAEKKRSKAKADRSVLLWNSKTRKPAATKLQAKRDDLKRASKN
jgi:hypothetical protein